MAADPKDIIAEAWQAHVDGSMRVVEGSWHAICDCGADLGDTGGSHDRAGDLHQKHLVEAIHDALANTGVLAEPGGEGSIYAVIKTVPGREFEILADLCTDVHEVRQWVADMNTDPDRDPLATYTAYRLVEVTNA